MRASRFSEEQIISILAKQQRGISASEIFRRRGMSSEWRWGNDILLGGERDGTFFFEVLTA